MKNAAAQKRILAQLSPALHSEVVWKVTERWLKSVRFLKDVEKELLVALAFHVSAKVFPPQEICPHGVLYIIDKGIALYAGKIVRPASRGPSAMWSPAVAWIGTECHIIARFVTERRPTDVRLTAATDATDRR